LSLQQGWATVQRERTIRMQAEQVRDASAAAERGRTTCGVHRMQY
jgi:hypothetical protein